MRAIAQEISCKPYSTSLSTKGHQYSCFLSSYHARGTIAFVYCASICAPSLKQISCQSHATSFFFETILPYMSLRNLLAENSPGPGPLIILTETTISYRLPPRRNGGMRALLRHACASLRPLPHVQQAGAVLPPPHRGRPCSGPVGSSALATDTKAGGSPRQGRC